LKRLRWSVNYKTWIRRQGMRHSGRQGRLQIVKLTLVLFLGIATTTAQIKSQGGSALERLSHAKIFAMGPVGWVGMTSQEEIDYRLILNRPTALVEFEKLYAEGNMQAKSYALTGIRQLSPARFKELYASLPTSNDTVNTMQGCILSQETSRNVAQSLASSPNPSK
jgi:hypothetical protein